MKTAFSKHGVAHQYDSVEVIERPGFDIKDISDTWKYFFAVVNDNMNIVNSFYNSSLAVAPRRTIQYQYKKDIDGWWGLPTISLQESDSFESVEALLMPLLENEEKEIYNVV